MIEILNTTSNNKYLNKTFIVFINALIYTIAFNAIIIAQRYNNYEAAGDNAIYAAIGELFFAFFYVFPIIYSCSIPNLFFKVLLILIYLISGLTAYFIYKLNISITSDIIASFFESSKSEITSLLSIDLILTIILSLMLGLFCLFSTKASRMKKSNDIRTIFISLVFSLGCLLGDGDWISNILPYNVLKETGTYWLEKTSVIKKRLNLSENYQYKIDSDSSEDLNIILIIGESARGDHFSLSGYERDTNPLLKKEKNLLYFNDVTACYPLTRTAVPCMITRATRDNRDASITETSFISIFKKLGFYTTWLGMQGTYTAIDAPYFDLAKESNQSLLLGTDVELFSSIDSSLFPFVDKFYQEHQDGKNLLILHTYGSHFHYEERYTDEFRKFTPTCRKKKFLSDMSHCSIEERINSYDNSILYTDYFIKNIIDKVRDKKSLVIYTSDHGESLGEGKRFLHGTHNADEQVAVNMVFWFSEKYIESYPNQIKSLKNLQNTPILHDHLFHSILGCSGIKSDAIDSKLNLCDSLNK